MTPKERMELIGGVEEPSALRLEITPEMSAAILGKLVEFASPLARQVAADSVCAAIPSKKRLAEIAEEMIATMVRDSVGKSLPSSKVLHDQFVEGMSEWMEEKISESIKRMEPEIPRIVDDAIRTKVAKRIGDNWNAFADHAIKAAISALAEDIMESASMNVQNSDEARVVAIRAVASSNGLKVV